MLGVEVTPYKVVPGPVISGPNSSRSVVVVSLVGGTYTAPTMLLGVVFNCMVIVSMDTVVGLVVCSKRIALWIAISTPPPLGAPPLWSALYFRFTM